MNHLTQEELHNHLDGELASDIELHLRACASCQSKLKALQAIDRSLRSMPLEHAGPGFTERVMQELRVSASPSFGWTVLRNLAPLLALAIVVTVTLVVLNLAGVFDTGEFRQTGVVAKGVYDKVGGSMTTGIQAFNSWISKYFSFAFANNTYGLTSFVLFFLGAIALLDKYLIMPMMRKRSM